MQEFPKSLILRNSLLTKFLYYAVFNVHGSPGKLFSPANFYILARSEDHVNIFFEVFSNFLCNCHRLLHKTDYVGLLYAAGSNALSSELLYSTIALSLCQSICSFFLIIIFHRIVVLKICYYRLNFLRFSDFASSLYQL